MKKNYFMPATKVVTVNAKAICEKSLTVSEPIINTGDIEEAPLF